MNRPVVLSLGSVNVDFQVRIDGTPEFGTTLLGRDFRRLGGGKAANVAFLARRLDVAAQLLARVGDDDLSEHALAPLREIGVDLARTSAVQGHSTGVALIAVPPDGQKTIILAGNANEAWTRDDASEVVLAIERAPRGSVLVVDYEIAGFVVEQAVEAASRRGLPVVLDPAPPDRVDWRLLPRIAVVVPDASETEHLTGIAIDDLAAGARAAGILLERGAQAACVKLKGGGCVLAQAEQTVHVAPVPVEVIDTTGAGDAFAGALAVALLEQRPMVEAACFAAAASLLAVAGYGSQPAYPTRADLEEVARQLEARTEILHQK